MPWYIFRCHHGPGHQSSSEQIRWYNETLSKEELREQWNEIFYNLDDACLNEGCAGVNGKSFEKLDKLLKSYKESMVRDYERKLKNATTMLAILKKTKTEAEYVIERKYLDKDWIGCSQLMTKKMANLKLKEIRKNYAKVKEYKYRVVKCNGKYFS